MHSILGFHSFLAKTPQSAIDAACIDGQATAIRALVHRIWSWSADAGKVRTKRRGTRTAPAGGEGPDERSMSLPGTHRLVEIPEDKNFLIEINRIGIQHYNLL